MDNQNNIQDELRNLDSGLPAQNSQPPFSVPEGYFDGLAASVMARIKGQDSSAAVELQGLSPFLASLPKTLPYTVPEGYFASTIASLPFLFADETSVVLDVVGKELPYTVPRGYFENLPKDVLQRVASPKGKVVPLFARSWMKAAVAAVIGGVMFIGGYRLLNSTENEESTARTSQPADSTQYWLAKNENAKVTQEIKTASTAELNAFIKSVPLNMDKLKEEKPKPAAGEKDVKDLLKNVSVNEMDDFLEQIPTGDEDLAVID